MQWLTEGGFGNSLSVFWKTFSAIGSCWELSVIVGVLDDV